MAAGPVRRREIDAMVSTMPCGQSIAELEEVIDRARLEAAGIGSTPDTFWGSAGTRLREVGVALRNGTTNRG